MTILVTGGNGFVGSAVVARLQAAGHRVLSPVRSGPTAFPLRPRIGPIETLSESDWNQLLEGVRAVVHTAAIAHIGPGVPEAAYMAVNRDATARLAKVAAARQIRTFVYVSSIRAQVGPSSPILQTEALDPKPTEAYGRSKLAGEILLRQYIPTATILRPSLVVGTPPKANLLSLLKVARLPMPLPFGQFVEPQSVVALDNLVEAIRLGVESERLTRGTFVVADQPFVTLADMLAWVREGLGRVHGLFGVPPELLRLPFQLIGKSDAYERLHHGLRIDASKLVSAGWTPVTRIDQAFHAIGRSGRGL